jgi:hypothetical protein
VKLKTYSMTKDALISLRKAKMTDQDILSYVNTSYGILGTVNNISVEGEIVISEHPKKKDFKK